MEFEAYDRYEKITFKVRFDDRHNRFVFTYPDGEWRKFSFRSYCTKRGMGRPDFDPRECTGEEQWESYEKGSIYITWKNEGQQKKIHRMIERQRCTYKIERITNEIAELDERIEEARRRLKEARYQVSAGPILLALCMPICLPRLKQNVWLPVDLFRLLAGYL